MRVLIHLTGDDALSSMESCSIAAGICALRASVFPTESGVLRAIRELEEERSPFLLVTGLDQRELARAIQLEGKYCKTSVLLCDKPLVPSLKQTLAEEGFARHLVPLGARLSRDLVPTLHRLAHPEFWPLSRWLATPAREHSISILVPRDLSFFKEVFEREFAMIGELSQKFMREGMFPRGWQAASELFDNALRATLGEAKSEDFVLASHGAIDMSFACDGETLGVSVTDKRGTLEPWTFFRSVFSRPGEAALPGKTSLGMGLRATLASSASVIASVSPGSSTCVQAFLPLERSQRAVAMRPKRVEYFTP